MLPRFHFLFFKDSKIEQTWKSLLLLPIHPLMLVSMALIVYLMSLRHPSTMTEVQTDQVSVVDTFVVRTWQRENLNILQLHMLLRLQ